MQRLKTILLTLFATASIEAAPSFSFEATELIRPGDRAIIEPAFHEAFARVKALPPSKGNPLSSRVKRRVHFVLTTATDPMAQKYGNTDSNDSDAFTLTDCDVESDADLVTYIFLLVDRLFWDPATGKQRPDAFVRLLVAIGHEMYGNLPSHLKTTARLVADDTPEAKQRDEIAAFTGGVDFLERLIASKFSKGLRTPLKKALARENKFLKGWEKAGCATMAKAAGQPPQIFLFTQGQMYRLKPTE